MRMIQVAQNKDGKIFAKVGHNKCNSTGVQGYVRKGETLVPVLCECVKFAFNKAVEKEGAEHAQAQS